jgi:hypothetical protein
VFLLFVSVLTLPLAAQADKSMVLRLTSTAPRIDGEIDPVWVQADSVSDFEQLSPFYGQPPSERTVVRLLATDEALYGLIVCYHEHAVIQDITGVHDQTSGDGASIMIDTFNDHQTAYKFYVSASGVQYDTRMVDDGRNRDNSWDGVWFAESRVHTWGYVVEMEIPFKSIRYSGELTEWGLDIDRWIAASKEDLYWCKYEQSQSQRISKFGRLILNGSRPVVKGLNLEIYPVAIARSIYTDAGKYRLNRMQGSISSTTSEKLTFQLTGNRTLRRSKLIRLSSISRGTRLISLNCARSSLRGMKCSWPPDGNGIPASTGRWNSSTHGASAAPWMTVHWCR